MQLIEQYLASKTGIDEKCEDGIFLSDAFVAVIDGSTDKSGLSVGGTTGGRQAMLACAEGLQALDASAEPHAAVLRLSSAVAARMPSDLPRDARPDAAIVVFSRARREVWQVGDVGYWHAGLPHGGTRPSKAVDRYVAEGRARILAAELALGADPTALAVHDPGRAAVFGILARQAVFRNNPGAGAWAYGGIDGHEVPRDLVAVHRVPDSATELVIASDGYPAILPTLAASEELLAARLAEDPLCIGSLRGTKGLTPGNLSYDDRAYLRVRLGE